MTKCQPYCISTSEKGANCCVQHCIFFPSRKILLYNVGPIGKWLVYLTCWSEVSDYFIQPLNQICLLHHYPTDTDYLRCNCIPMGLGHSHFHLTQPDTNFSSANQNISKPNINRVPQKNLKYMQIIVWLKFVKLMS